MELGSTILVDGDDGPPLNVGYFERILRNYEDDIENHAWATYYHDNGYFGIDYDESIISDRTQIDKYNLFTVGVSPSLMDTFHDGIIGIAEQNDTTKLSLTE